VEVVPLAQPKQKRSVKCNKYDRSTFGGCEYFRHKFAVTPLIVFSGVFVSLESIMSFTDQEGTVRFINALREQRRWLSRELSSLDARSVDYESNQRAIRGAIGELDTVIWKAMEEAGMVSSCRMTVTRDDISAPELRGTVFTRCAPAK
jgi:hypothetical protein